MTSDENPYKREGMYVVTRGIARNMEIYWPFPDNIAALRWAHKKWGDGGYMIKEVRAPS